MGKNSTLVELHIVTVGDVHMFIVQSPGKAREKWFDIFLLVQSVRRYLKQNRYVRTDVRLVQY